MDPDTLQQMFPNLSLQQVTYVLDKHSEMNSVIDECLELQNRHTSVQSQDDKPKDPVHFEDSPHIPPISQPLSTVCSTKLTNSELRKLHQARINRIGVPKSQPKQGSLSDIRKIQQDRWQRNKKPRKPTTFASLQQAQESFVPASDSTSDRSSVHTIDNTILDPLRLGKECLRRTNEFRAKHKLPALQWNQRMFDIGVVHSKNMCEKVFFSHKGFDQRTAQFGFSFRTAAENVAMSTNVADPAATAVDGWIDSPGHRKNLLGSFSKCGIGVYKSGPTFYFTQLFAG
ncbi:hypothetical protein GEMRC1_003442 [Eukaryota sp. GEM-RC1]